MPSSNLNIPPCINEASKRKQNIKASRQTMIDEDGDLELTDSEKDGQRSAVTICEYSNSKWMLWWDEY